MATLKKLKAQNNRPLYINTVIGTVHWLLMGWLLHLVQRGADWAAATQPRPLLAVPNVTAHPSTASVPTSYHLMWQYNCL